MRLADAIAIAMLLVTGAACGRCVGRSPLLFGIAMVLPGRLLVALTIGLGDDHSTSARRPQLFQCSLKIDGPGRGKGPSTPGAGMSESQFVRVQQHARRNVAGEVGEFPRLLRAISFVAGDRKTKVLKVDADLVRAAGVQVGLDQG
jgi:hypothetical protein